MDFYRVKFENVVSISRYACDFMEIISLDFTVFLSRKLAKLNAHALAEW
ncbi:hypothetical protein ABRP72_19480 [Pectobacterium carotovorum]